MVIDGTGKEYQKIKKQRAALMRLGYDTMMIFVNTNLETALDRNAKRSRSLAPDKVKVFWAQAQDNIGKYQNLFGRNFIVVDNSNGGNAEGATMSAFKRITA